MSGDIDYSDMGSYLVSIAKRIASLEVTADELESHIDEQIEDVRHSGTEFKDEIRSLREDLREVNLEVSELSKSVSQLIQEFKRVARESSLERLERKIEEWEPERVATHKDLHRQVRKLRREIK